MAKSPDGTVDKGQSVKEPKNIKVFVADASELFRRGVEVTINDDDRMTVVGMAGLGDDVVARIKAEPSVVVILDVALPGTNETLCSQICANVPGAKVVLLATKATDDVLCGMMAGAKAVLDRGVTSQELIRVVASVYAGHSLLREDDVAALISRLNSAPVPQGPLAGLTVQQRQVVDLIGEGLTNRQIAGRMFVAEKTVKNYVSQVFAKLGLQRRTQIAPFVAELHKRSD